ncbi:hypothetical protein BD626DRAFT_564039 [Schizophyllum amplum]|uniref:Uncharacterized protein n=1 Tax=Schizophyllum amplum TaxID=97359 RepID=A0A550D025_9AGAR|nr:hypothetical protein BD626DRAFT_564039 [Auriculariopsis ampla]
MEEEVKAANGAPAKENKNTSDEKDTKDEAEDAEGEKQEIPFPFERLWALVLAPVGFGESSSDALFTSLLAASMTALSAGQPAHSLCLSLLLRTSYGGDGADVDGPRPITLTSLTKDDMGAWRRRRSRERTPSSANGKRSFGRSLCKGNAPALTEAQQDTVQAQLDVEAGGGRASRV